MKERLDTAMVSRGFAETREKARVLIMSGCVLVDGDVCDKPGTQIRSRSSIEVRQGLKYASRGGLKLEKALQVFPIDLKGKVCADIGASTGGFTDCMLQNGAEKVYCIDVGYGQLAWKLRTDDRVVNFERTNFRYFDPSLIPGGVDFFSADVSFISLSLILPKADLICRKDGEGVCLIKPQFEAGREKVGKNGVVRERSTRMEVIEKCLGYALENGFFVSGLDYSPIKGPKGNVEYLMHLTRDDRGFFPDPESVVDRSIQELERRGDVQ
ncbi:MAG: TlyA family RNA methyltransferase [Oscillospiraceae bacterium]|jgi:23S rRNA (cytidine1920-2'-O)/16S rRNA (cytidine1409-2'-O)-methyltransferase